MPEAPSQQPTISIDADFVRLTSALQSDYDFASALASHDGESHTPATLVDLVGLEFNRFISEFSGSARVAISLRAHVTMIEAIWLVISHSESDPAEMAIFLDQVLGIMFTDAAVRDEIYAYMLTLGVRLP